MSQNVLFKFRLTVLFRKEAVFMFESQVRLNMTVSLGSVWAVRAGVLGSLATLQSLMKIKRSLVLVELGTG